MRGVEQQRPLWSCQRAKRERGGGGGDLLGEGMMHWRVTLRPILWRSLVVRAGVHLHRHELRGEVLEVLRVLLVGWVVGRKRRSA
jgi:hypothetical protein